MPNLNERIRRLEDLHPAQSVVDMLEPEQVTDILKETIRVLERDVSEGRGGELFGGGSDARTALEALSDYRGYLADWELEHDLAY